MDKQVTKSKKVKTVSLLGSVSLLTQDGQVLTVEDLAGSYGNTVKVAFSAPYGRVKFKTVKNLRPSDITVQEVTKLFLSNGHVLTATEFDKFVTAEGEITKVSDLEVGDSISVLCYNPKTKFLSSLVAKVETLYRTNLHQGPQFLYDIDFSSEECLPLLSSEVSSGDVSCVVYGNVSVFESD